MTVVLRSPYSPDECERRLKISIERGSPVGGTIGVGVAVLHRRSWYINSFRPVLAVTWNGAEAGTEIRGRARLHVFAIVFLVAWFGLGALIGVALLLAAVTEALGPVVLMLLGGGAVVMLGRFSARNDERYLLDFVRYMLDAEDGRTG